MKTKLFFGAATAALLLSSAASAQSWYSPGTWFQDGQWYVGADGGYHFPEALKGESTRVGSDGIRPSWKFGSDNDNYAVFAKGGYAFSNGLRLELEYGYRNGDLDSIHGVGSAVQPIGLCAPGVGRSVASPACGGVKGDLNASTLMFNAIYDFKQFRIPGPLDIHPFIGAGVGGAFVQTKAYGQLSGVPAGYAPIENTSFDDDKSAFAYQGMAGLTWDVRPHLAVDLTYRYLEADRVLAPSVTSNTGPAGAPVYDVGTFKGDYKDSAVTIGVRYLFGGHAEAPPPPPPAAPEAHPYVVYFPWDKSILVADAQSVVQSAATDATSHGATGVAVVGYTDTSGSVAYNVRLSERRAKVVADALVGLGVSQSIVSVDWKGKSDLAVQTPDGVREPLNRRATITLQIPGASEGAPVASTPVPNH
jgi:OOP family OmpA-OmpF porin